MAKKPASLSDALMPVEEQAAIPPRVEKAELPKATKAESQNGSEPFVGLNFKVRAGFRREFKTWCAQNDMPLVEALAEAFALLKANRGQ